MMLPNNGRRNFPNACNLPRDKERGRLAPCGPRDVDKGSRGSTIFETRMFNQRLFPNTAVRHALVPPPNALWTPGGRMLEQNVDATTSHMPETSTTLCFQPLCAQSALGGRQSTHCGSEKSVKSQTRQRHPSPKLGVWNVSSQGLNLWGCREIHKEQ